MKFYKHLVICYILLNLSFISYSQNNQYKFIKIGKNIKSADLKLPKFNRDSVIIILENLTAEEIKSIIYIRSPKDNIDRKPETTFSSSKHWKVNLSRSTQEFEFYFYDSTLKNSSDTFTIERIKLKDISFLPHSQNYQNFLNNRKQQRTTLDNEYRIIYDFKNRHIYYPEPNFSEKRKKVTNLNKNIIFEVININPLLYTVSINNAIINRNLELRPDFEKWMTPTPKANGNNIPDTPKKNGALNAALDTLGLFITLSKELDSFYTEKVNDQSPDTDLLKEEMSFIIGNIKYAFDLQEPITKTKLLNKGVALLNSINEPDTTEHFMPYIEKASNLFYKLNNVSYTIASGIIEPGNNDELEFELIIKREEIIVIEPAKYKIMISGGFKADFSSGIYFTRLTDNLYTLQQETIKDTSFYVDPYFITTDSILAINEIQKQKIIPDDRGKFDIGLMIAAHFYSRTGYRLNVAATTGLGIDPEHGPRYMLGGSLIWGYENRVSFTYGLILGKVKTLASSLNEGNFYDGNADQLYKDIWKTKNFFAITYNFGSASLTKKKDD